MKILGIKVEGIGQYIIMLLVIGLISLLFPNSNRFKYEFDKGQRWQYEDLIAPFNFALRKSAEEINKDKEELEIIPFYVINPDRARQRKNIFIEEFDQQLKSVATDSQFKHVNKVPEQYKKYGRGLIDRIYQRGVITQGHPLYKEKADQVIQLRSGNATTNKTVQMLVKSEDIGLWLTDSLFESGLEEAEFLIPLLEKDYASNVELDRALTDKYKAEQEAKISTTYGMVRKGELIVAQNQYITDSVYKQLVSYRLQYQETVGDDEASWIVFLGYLLLTTFVLLVYALYIQYHAPNIFKNIKPFSFFMMWPLLYAYLVFMLRSNDSISLYIVPFSIVPIVVNIFYNEKIALFTHVVVVLIASYLTDLGYGFIFLQLVAGLVAVLSNVNVRDWTRFFYSMLSIFFAYGIAYLGQSLSVEGSFEALDWSHFSWIFLNVFLTLLAIPLIPLLERIFGFTSALTLTDLSDMNQNLLKELSLKAPGTLQHSLQVANLAEAAARKIDANAHLVKVAALYHDIGKIKNPEYFIENVKGENPHKDLSAIESAKIILEHVSYGEELALKNKLPEIIIQFIRSHHGTTLTAYFYHQYLQENPDGEKDIALFQYPGPRPRTREEAILMMADSIEAAAKALPEPDEEKLSQLVDNIVEGKIMSHQLDRSTISFREVETCKREFKKILESIYHVRVKYPSA